MCLGGENTASQMDMQTERKMQIHTYGHKHLIELLTVNEFSLLDITTGGDWSYGLSRLSRSACMGDVEVSAFKVTDDDCKAFIPSGQVNLSRGQCEWMERRRDSEEQKEVMKWMDKEQEREGEVQKHRNKQTDQQTPHQTRDSHLPCF